MTLEGRDLVDDVVEDAKNGAVLAAVRAVELGHGFVEHDLWPGQALVDAEMLSLLDDLLHYLGLSLLPHGQWGGRVACRAPGLDSATDGHGKQTSARAGDCGPQLNWCLLVHGNSSTAAGSCGTTTLYGIRYSGLGKQVIAELLHDRSQGATKQRLAGRYGINLSSVKRLLKGRPDPVISG